MKKANKQPSAFDKYLAVRTEAIEELLRERESLKQQSNEEVARFRKLLAQNAKKLEALDYAVKDAGVVSATKGNQRLPDSEIEKGLRRILAHESRSIPEICQLLRIARSRFEKFKKTHPKFLKQEGNFKSTVYRLNPRSN
jgi:hypothetical protein